MHLWTSTGLHQARCLPVRSSGGQAATQQSTLSRLQSSHPFLYAGLISGSLSIVGDLLAQTLSRQGHLDRTRTARMGGFGLCLYGPYQNWWYGRLEARWPLKSTEHFLTKVTLNQLALAPVVLAAVFTWNLVLQRQHRSVPQKLRHDLLPTMTTGWKFWIPASSINFWLVPVKQQVLYMSLCGVFWSAYLSYSSNLQVAPLAEGTAQLA